MSHRKLHFLELLFRRHGKELVAFAGQRSGGDAAEDLVQEAYLRLLEHPAPESIENARAYLYRVTGNLGADLFRRQQVRERHSADTETDLESIPCPHPLPEITLDARQRLDICLSALDSLPEIYRHAFLLHRIEGLTHAEIGAALNLPRRTVERYCAKALARCLVRLRDTKA